MQNRESRLFISTPDAQKMRACRFLLHPHIYAGICPVCQFAQSNRPLIQAERDCQNPGSSSVGTSMRSPPSTVK